jgi:putative tricarboxylic transport membrane protein
LRLGNQIIAMTLLVLGIAMAWHAPTYGMFTVKIGAGPGLLPMLIGIGMAVTAAAVFITSTRNEPRELQNGVIPGRQASLRLLGILIVYVAAVVLIEPFGYRLTMFLFLVSTMWLLGRRDIILVLAGGLVGSLGVYWAFTEKLLVTLPTGFFGF